MALYSFARSTVDLPSQPFNSRENASASLVKTDSSVFGKPNMGGRGNENYRHLYRLWQLIQTHITCSLAQLIVFYVFGPVAVAVSLAR